jgi:DNA-directed RNA polymerase subunit F
MIGKRIIEEKPISIPEALELLEKQKKGEMEYSQRLAHDYAQKFAGVDAETARKIKEELSQMDKLNEQQIVMIIDLLPKTKQDVEIIFQKSRTRLDDSEVTQILDIIKKYVK